MGVKMTKKKPYLFSNRAKAVVMTVNESKKRRYIAISAIKKINEETDKKAHLKTVK